MGPVWVVVMCQGPDKFISMSRSVRIKDCWMTLDWLWMVCRSMSSKVWECAVYGVVQTAKASCVEADPLQLAYLLDARGSGQQRWDLQVNEGNLRRTWPAPAGYLQQESCNSNLVILEVYLGSIRLSL